MLLDMQAFTNYTVSLFSRAGVPELDLFGCRRTRTTRRECAACRAGAPAPERFGLRCLQTTAGVSPIGVHRDQEVSPTGTPLASRPGGLSYPEGIETGRVHRQFAIFHRSAGACPRRAIGHASAHHLCRAGSPDPAYAGASAPERRSPQGP